MDGYELTLRKEVLLEKAAGILGDLFRLQQNSSDRGIAEAASVMFSLVGGEKNNILMVEDVSALDGIEHKFDLSQRFTAELEKRLAVGKTRNE